MSLKSDGNKSPLLPKIQEETASAQERQKVAQKNIDSSSNFESPEFEKFRKKK